MTIVNPEKEYKSTPKLFSEVSKIIDLKSKDYWMGIILDSPKEFAQALKIYNSDLVKGARSPSEHKIDEIAKQHGPFAAGFLISKGKKMAEGFLEKLIPEALSELQSSGWFGRKFEYSAIGTNFFKTRVDCTKIGDKYLLEVSPTYVNREELEITFAKTLGKPMALETSRVKAKLSIVDDWWFNVNLEEVLQDLPISKKKVCDLVKYIVKDAEIKKPKIEFKYDGQKFALDIDVDVDKYLMPKNGKILADEYLQARESFIVGGAWTKTENVPKPKNPSIVISVSLPGMIPSLMLHQHTPAMTQKQITTLQNARNYISEIIRPK